MVSSKVFGQCFCISLGFLLLPLQGKDDRRFGDCDEHHCCSNPPLCMSEFGPTLADDSIVQLVTWSAYARHCVGRTMSKQDPGKEPAPHACTHVLATTWFPCLPWSYLSDHCEAGDDIVAITWTNAPIVLGLGELHTGKDLSVRQETRHSQLDCK